MALVGMVWKCCWLQLLPGHPLSRLQAAGCSSSQCRSCLLLSCSQEVALGLAEAGELHISLCPAAGPTPTSQLLTSHQSLLPSNLPRH